MAAYKYGTETKKTERYKLGEVLSKTSNHLLFLTATPHKGDPENFRLLLDLLKPGFFATSEMLEESINNKDNPIFIRRLKEDLKEFEGKPIFTHRYPKTIKFRLSDEEKKLYNELSKYVVQQYNKALNLDKNRNIGFALLILQRRMASSTYALLKSLERRKKRLEELLSESDLEKGRFILEDLEDVEDYQEEERWKEEKRWETLSLARNKEELKEEIDIIKSLIEKAKKIVEEEKEIKLNELKKAIEEGFKEIRKIGGNEKILIFTESRDTLEYLVEKIKSWGYSVNYIHGGMDLEKRIEAEREFRDRTQIMVATEAAGEGINLQFCNLMINYDIPWNPNRLEQRIGRIHRYGQQKDVFIFNLVAVDTREGEVLAKLFEKLEEIKSKLGSDRVFDVIGDVFFGKNLYQLILDAVSQARSLDDIIQELDNIKVDEKYIQEIRKALGESLATKFIDYTRIRELSEKAKENRLIPDYVEEFFKKAFQKAGGRYRIRKDGFISIESIPFELKKIAEKNNLSLKTYPKATFDKDKAFKNTDAEFIYFGHPLLETLMDWVHQSFFNNLQKGAVFEDPEGKYDGIIWFFEGEINDGKGETVGKKVFAVYDDGKDFKEINPAILWDLIPVDENNASLSIDGVEQRKKVAEEFSINLMISYRKEIKNERERQAEIKIKYGVKSLDYLIMKLDEELVQYYERDKKGENVDLVIRNKEERKAYYMQALEELKKEIEQERSLSISMPRFIGAVLVRPRAVDNMVSDEEIERIGMEVVMKYERSQGREPEDVSKRNLGFDIRSRGKGEIRYIEVKARKDEGAVALTVNEWLKAKMLKENYWLYIVCNAIINPTIYIINNPAENLKVQDKVEIVRFIVPLEEWKKKGEKV